MRMRKEFADMTEPDILFKLNQDYPDQSFDVVLKCWEITDRKVRITNIVANIRK